MTRIEITRSSAFYMKLAYKDHLSNVTTVLILLGGSHKTTWNNFASKVRNKGSAKYKKKSDSFKWWATTLAVWVNTITLIIYEYTCKQCDKYENHIQFIIYEQWKRKRTCTWYQVTHVLKYKSYCFFVLFFFLTGHARIRYFFTEVAFG